MIQTQSKLDVADNTGAKSVMCIKVLGGSKRRYASVGDVIKVSIKEAAPRGRVKKARFTVLWLSVLPKASAVVTARSSNSMATQPCCLTPSWSLSVPASLDQ